MIGAGAHTLSLSGSTIWLEGVQLPLRNLPVAIAIDETDLVSAWQQALIQLDLDPKTDAYVLALPASLPVRYAAVLTVINALVDFVTHSESASPAGGGRAGLGKAGHVVAPTATTTPVGSH